jgi:hypothetical protein
VRILHPDWTDDMWDAEVKKWKTEFASVVDPNELPPENPHDNPNDGPTE